LPVIPGLRIETLRRDHKVEGFDCGVPPLNRFLVVHALQAQLSGASRTYVALSDETIVGYYTIVVGEVAHDQAPERLKKGMARHPIPLVVLARLAVGRDWQGRGLGVGLVRDAMDRTLVISEVGAVRALAVQAKDDAAAAFYEHLGFMQSPLVPRQFFLLIKEIIELRRQ
jgi:GNAT superfamily N-acetyltransferase